MTILNESAKGVYIIAVTPFADDGSLDLASADRMVDSYIASGVTGITLLGIMGRQQSSRLKSHEHLPKG